MLEVQINQVHPKATKFFSNLILEIFGEANISNRQNGICDIQINGVRMSQQRIFLEKAKAAFGGGSRNVPPELMYQRGEMVPNREARLNIWYTGENLRPPLHLDYDYFLSFDQDSFGGKNIYFPLWYLDYDWGFGEKFVPRIGVVSKGIELSEPRTLMRERSGFACAFIGHIHPIRFEAVRQLAEIGKVDVFGRAVGRPVASKLSVASRYRYTICFENDLYPGYVTEKPLDAYYCDTVPIYWGDLGFQNVINPESHLNLHGHTNLDSFKERIASINIDDYRQMYSQPFLNRPPDLTQLKTALINAV
jgi:hypothetical protein